MRVRDVRGPERLDDAVAEAAAVLRGGGVVALPTETVYGIAALPDLPGATEQLFALKGRRQGVPIAVLGADIDQALALSDEPSTDAVELATAHWPGPLTLVLRRRAGLDYELGEPATTIGVRCPDHQLVQRLAAEVGPIATTSANPHGQPTPTAAAAVAELFEGKLGLILDGGECTGQPSTVVDVTGGPRSTWRVLRPGPVSITD